MHGHRCRIFLTPHCADAQDSSMPEFLYDTTEPEFSFIHASGPGGQNVNKVATAAQLRFNIPASTSLPHNVKERLLIQAKNRITFEGTLILTAQRFRTQEQNRLDALNRLNSLIAKAFEEPKPRRASRPTLASIRNRRLVKQRRSGVKRLRREKPSIE
jgi:ribosome-associated protein